MIMYVVETIFVVFIQTFFASSFFHNLRYGNYWQEKTFYKGHQNIIPWTFPIKWFNASTEEWFLTFCIDSKNRPFASTQIALKLDEN